MQPFGILSALSQAINYKPISKRITHVPGRRGNTERRIQGAWELWWPEKPMSRREPSPPGPRIKPHSPTCEMSVTLFARLPRGNGRLMNENHLGNYPGLAPVALPPRSRDCAAPPPRAAKAQSDLPALGAHRAPDPQRPDGYECPQNRARWDSGSQGRPRR